MEMFKEKTREILKKVRRIEIRTKRLVSDALCGAYHSIFKGQGMDFEEVRAYTPGDDVRSIDWNVTAKTGHPHVKVFREERELTILILVDLSASGRFGSGDRSKRELAGELASVLAFSATRNQDKVGLLLFTDHVEKFVVPKKGRQHVLRVIREILFFEPKGRQTNIRGALEHLLRTQKRKAVVFLISDFLENGELPTLDRAGGKDFFRLLAIANKRHDVICVAMRDAREEALPDVGIISLEDSETGEVVEVNTGSRALRERYAKESTRRLKAFKQGCAQSRVDVMEICNRSPEVAEVAQEVSGGKGLSVKEMDYMQALRGFLRRRQRSRRRV